MSAGLSHSHLSFRRVCLYSQLNRRVFSGEPVPDHLNHYPGSCDHEFNSEGNILYGILDQPCQTANGILPAGSSVCVLARGGNREVMDSVVFIDRIKIGIHLVHDKDAHFIQKIKGRQNLWELRGTEGYYYYDTIRQLQNDLKKQVMLLKSGEITNPFIFEGDYTIIQIIL